jgi:hypothetical protein
MPRPTTKTPIEFITIHDVKYAQEHLIAAAGLLYAIHHQYAQEGVLSVGAVLHVAGIVDRVIEKLKLDELDLGALDLPF